MQRRRARWKHRGLLTTVSATIPVIVLAACLLLAPRPGYAGYAEGKAAYDSGDYATAWKELDPLAKSGNADAMFLVGSMYHTGRGVPPSYRDAAIWYRKSADAGKIDAIFTMGFVYEGGIGVPRSLKDAFTWYKKAADRGMHIAQAKVGNMYAKAQGVPKDLYQAYYWFAVAERTVPLNSNDRYEIPIVKDKLAEFLTKDQVADADRKAKAWKAIK